MPRRLLISIDGHRHPHPHQHPLQLRARGVSVQRLPPRRRPVLPATRARTAAVLADDTSLPTTRANFDERWAAGLVQFKWTDRTPELKALLRHVLLEGRHAIFGAPTGYGKQGFWAWAAWLTGSVVVVLEPLLAIMDDVALDAKKLGLRAVVTTHGPRVQGLLQCGQQSAGLGRASSIEPGSSESRGGAGRGEAGPGGR